MWKNVVGSLTLEADAQILKELCVMQVVANGLATVCTVDAVDFVGVTLEDGDSAAPFAVPIQFSGIARCQSNGAAAMNPRDQVALAAAGQVKTRAIADGATNRTIIGRCLSIAAATANLIVYVQLHPFHIFST